MLKLQVKYKDSSKHVWLCEECQKFNNFNSRQLGDSGCGFDTITCPKCGSTDILDNVLVITKEDYIQGKRK